MNSRFDTLKTFIEQLIRPYPNLYNSRPPPNRLRIHVNMSIHFIQNYFKSCALRTPLKSDNERKKSICVKQPFQTCISKEVKFATTIH